MFEFFSKLFDTSDFPARWNCGTWSGAEGWLHITSDLATWAAYMTIPLVLLYFARRRKDVPFTRVIILFAAFILACGTVHLVEAIIFWYPVYRLSGLLKLVTAIVSWGTVIALIRIAPLALELPSVKTVNERLRREIAQRTQTELQLAESERRFRSTFENAAVGMAHVATDGHWLQVNDRLCQILGYSREELLNKTFQDVTLPFDLEADVDLAQQVLRGEIANYSMEKRYVHCEGHHVWANLTVSLVKDVDGQPEYFISIIEEISERILAQEASRRSQEIFVNLVEDAPFGVYLIDADFVMQRVSKGATKVFENVQPLIGRDFGEILHQVWPAPFAAEAVSRFRHTLETGESFQSADTYEQRADIGEVESYHWQLERITMPDNRFGVVCYFFELTQLRRAEHALRQQEQRQSMLLSFLQAGREKQDEQKMLAAAAESLGRHLRAHRIGFLEIGNDSEMLFGECWSDGTLPRLELTMPIEAIGQGYAAKVRSGSTIGIADVDNHPLTVDSSFARIETKACIFVPIIRNGQWQAGLYVNQAEVRQWTTEEVQFLRKAADQIWDAVEKMRFVQALEISESRLRLATELANMGVLHCDYAESAIMFDETAAKLFDLPADQPVSLPDVANRFHPDDVDWLSPLMGDEVPDENGGALSGEHRVVHSDGTVRWLDVSKQFYFSHDAVGNSQPTHAVVAAIDVTERKEHETNLNEARLLAEAANHARGEFLANMSHEIRTPMTAILGYADLLGDHLQDPDNMQYVDTIQRNGRYLLEIINDILDLSKIDAGKLNIQVERISPEKIVADAIALMNVRAQDRRIELVAQIQGKIPKLVETDGKRLRQILLNLIGNAIKFTDHGSVKLSVRFNQSTKKLEFEIRDSGIGIQADDLDNLFQPFKQVDASNTRAFGGSGLGLVISRRLAQLLGGDIHAESEFGRGSTFTFSIDPGPVDVSSLVEPNQVASTPTTEAPKPVDVSLTGHYLIVDDRREIRFLAQHLIEKAGGRTTVASNGQEGVDAVTANVHSPFSAILMDMQMPILDGYAATAELRSRGVTIPIIALTANAMDGDADKCLQAGCNAFLSKPIDRDRLLAILHEFSRTNS